MPRTHSYCSAFRSPFGLAASLLILIARPAAAYVPDERWSSTASGSTGSDGDPATITWSIARDGTSILSEGNSNLVSYLDGLFQVTSGDSDLTTRPWFGLLEDSFERWNELGGVTFVYEPNDNGLQVGSNSAGALGARGDIRIGGALIDGSSGTLAYTYLPNNGDMVIDTSETSFFSNSGNNYRQLRNTVMHELGHAIGLLHIESSSDRLLLEPYIDVSFDGPQLDDIRGLHGLYGDFYEKSNDGAGNDSYQLATSLGAIAASATTSIGVSAATGQSVDANEVDFVSISNAADNDYFSFTVNSASLLDVTLTPWGGVFTQGAQGGPQSTFDANSRNDLTLTVFGADGATLLASANSTLAGFPESLAELSLPAAGQYYLRVSGSTANVQLYQLDLSIEDLIESLPGDFDGDGDADGADLLVWQRSFGQIGAGLSADGNDDGAVDGLDLAVWKNNFGNLQGDFRVAGAAIPEPAAARLFLLGSALMLHSQRPRRPSKTSDSLRSAS